MTRSVCIHAGAPGKDKTRECNHAGRGGLVRHLGECQSCPLWEPKFMNREVPVSLGCVHRQELTGRERDARGLSHGKRWSLCLAPDPKPLGREVVCPCNGCGPKCPGYTESE